MRICHSLTSEACPHLISHLAVIGCCTSLSAMLRKLQFNFRAVQEILLQPFPSKDCRSLKWMLIYYLSIEIVWGQLDCTLCMSVLPTIIFASLYTWFTLCATCWVVFLLHAGVIFCTLLLSRRWWIFLYLPCFATLAWHMYIVMLWDSVLCLLT